MKSASAKKAEFALDVISAERLEDLAIPSYIHEGLAWLQGRLNEKSDVVVNTQREAVSI